MSMIYLYLNIVANENWLNINKYICIYWLKHPKSVPQKTNFGPKYKWFKISNLYFFFWKYFFGLTLFYNRLHMPVDIIRVFFNSRFCSRKYQSQQKLTKKITHFTIQFLSKNLTHFTNLNSLDTENNMHPKCSQKPSAFYKCFSKHVSVWCQKNYLYCTISWRPRTAFLKHFKSKCLYISVYLLKKIFVPKR